MEKELSALETADVGPWVEINTHGWCKRMKLMHIEEDKLLLNRKVHSLQSGVNTGATKKSRMESSGSEIIRPVVEDPNADDDNSKRVACGRDMEEEEKKASG